MECVDLTPWDLLDFLPLLELKMIKVLFRISEKIEKESLESMKKALDSINKEFSDNEIAFEYSTYSFDKLERKEIEEDPSSFLYSKREKIQNKTKDRHNSIIYIPDSSTNLKGNYLWYSSGNPKDNAMMISSYLFKELINKVKKDLGFGAYVLLIYSQFLARFTVALEQAHEKSQNCLNDHCAYQNEILNVFKNPDDVLCKECRSGIISGKEEYYSIIKKIAGFIKDNYLKKTGTATLQSSVYIAKPGKPKVKPKESKAKFIFKPGHHYELELFVAKKFINLATLYAKLDKLLKTPHSAIYGYSLYEVDGGWREGINLSADNADDWNKLKSLKKIFDALNVKDLIRPIFEDGQNNKFAVYDERSIVLKIVVESKDKIEAWDEDSHPAMGEILDIFEEITENETSVFFTVKKLDRSGYIKREDND